MYLETGIQAPPKPVDRVRWPFNRMRVSDSFAVAAELRERCRSAANAYKRAHNGWNYTLRKENPNQWRCWRTE